jgi:hypothetical protein
LAATLWQIRPGTTTAFVLCISTLAVAQDVPNDKCVLEGIVRNSVTHGALAKASIHLIPIAGSAQTPGYVGATNGAGIFRFEGIAPGAYAILVSRAGYSDDVLMKAGPEPVGAVLTFTAGQELTGMEISLVPYGGISGKVTGPDGEPLEDIRVDLIAAKWQRGRRVYQSIGSSETDGTGEYRLDAPPGRYYIYAGVLSGSGPIAGIIRESPGKPELRLTGGYHPGATAWEGAAPVELQAGMEVGGIDFRLYLAPVFHVRGKLAAGAVHERFGGIVARLAGRINGQACDWDQPASAMVLLDGSFDFSGVVPGPYFLYADNRGFFPGGNFRGVKVPLMVTARDQNGITGPVAQWFDLKGRIRLAGEASASAVPDVEVIFEGSGADQLDLWRSRVNPKPDGTFSITGLTPDRYAVRIVNRNRGQGGGFYLKSFLYQGRETAANWIDLTGGVAGEVELVLSDGVGSVEGTVHWPEEDENIARMAPAGELRAVLAPEKIPLADTRPASTEVDQNGHFSLGNLAPGTYRAFAMNGYDEGLWENAEFLGRIAGQGTPVEVAEKGTIHVELKVLRAGEAQQAETQLK